VSTAPELDAAIAAEQAKLAELEEGAASARRRLAELQARRKNSGGVDGGGEMVSSSSWLAERKVALFASLFRGREDVFPQRWVSRDKARTGWAPKCSNEWRPGVCEKPRIKCGECSNQGFVPPDERQLLAHLQGRQVMGVYPLLADDSCWLLAIDLDGRSWRRDVAAIREACSELEVVPAVERSRSGQGAHVWFFFDAAVPATVARRFGIMLLTDAMARCSTLGMASYDRLFPSQDMLPTGGFGNLIARPLQRDVRRHGNTLFLDDGLEPYGDQWAYLDSVPRIASQRLKRLVAYGERYGRALGDGKGSSRHETAPWRPARPLASRLAAVEPPEAVQATLAQRLYVERDELSAPVLDAMRRLATFSNPKFLERQRMRLSTARTPRVIACFEETGRFLALPRGCRDSLEELLEGLGTKLEVADERTDGRDLDARFTGELAPAQVLAAQDMLAHELGVLCAPPGRGKTVIAAHLIAARARSTVVLVHRKPLLEQWIERLSQFLDVDSEAIGVIGGGRRKPTGLIDVAMVQSLSRHNALGELLSAYGHLVVDECHHVPAVTTERVLQEAPARHVTGLTATPQRRDGHHPIIAMQCGPTRHTMDHRSGPADRALRLRVLRRNTSFDPSALPTDASIQETYGALVDDEERTAMIAADALQLIAEDRSPVILTERREHLERLRACLIDRVPTLITLHGEMPAAKARATAERLGGIPDGEPCLVLATGRYLGEGFDAPRLDTLLLAMPVAWKGTVIQYAGRLHRAHVAKREARVYDYVDAEVPVLRRMFAKRLKAYRALGYELAEVA
jgi:superfamily II DNA or RNA helicase